eukprot:gnl/Hemi2/12107_TR4133_c0_g1_i1.p1 gnl/Hemi2/12107_TR4133_c0_g1~~gnl/Hemi2/12107_TR4133_c0_g1_i1.p1  ORF type:complete len:414 (+),score=101.40 gnl/Hemi2/12107_TR4133_c0_g1_i1:73-1242(+)
MSLDDLEELSEEQLKALLEGSVLDTCDFERIAVPGDPGHVTATTPIPVAPPPATTAPPPTVAAATNISVSKAPAEDEHSALMRMRAHACRAEVLNAQPGVMMSLTQDGGVRKMLRKPGTGQPASKVNARVAVKYKAFFSATSTEFDRQDRFIVNVGIGVILPVWEVALPTMKVNESATIESSATYAYGDLGCPPRIPPKQAVTFRVKVLEIVNPVDTPETLKTKSVAQKLEAAHVDHELGNDFMKKKATAKARTAYNRAVGNLGTIKEDSGATPEEWAEKTALVLNLQRNLAVVHLQSKSWAKVREVCNAVLKELPDDRKCLLRRSEALKHLHFFDESLADLMHLTQICPEDAEVLSKFRELSLAKDQHKEEEKKRFAGLFSAPTPKQQ